MELTIISPVLQKKMTIAWLEINTPVGNFVIQKGHAPMVVTLSAHQPIIFGLPNGTQQSIIIIKAVVEVTRTGATVIVS